MMGSSETSDITKGSRALSCMLAAFLVTCARARAGDGQLSSGNARGFFFFFFFFRFGAGFNYEYRAPLCVWVGSSKQTPIKSSAFMYSWCSIYRVGDCTASESQVGEPVLKSVETLCGYYVRG